jgi:hypothetical protein
MSDGTSRPYRTVREARLLSSFAMPPDPTTPLTPEQRLAVLGELLSNAILRVVADRRRLPTLEETPVDEVAASAPDRRDPKESR